MRCPACARALSSCAVGGLDVDVCDDGCGGVWFDHDELRKLDEDSESAGEQLLEISRDPDVRVDPSKRYVCPACTDGVVMMRHFWSVKRAVIVDECPECGGIFLDAGELRRIRSEFPTAAARHAAADAYFRQVADPLLAAARVEDEAGLVRARKLAHAFRFITPSWYLTGKRAGATL